MNYLLDTNAISALVREDPKLAARLSSIAAGDSVAKSVIVRGEILFGIERLPSGKKRDELQFEG